LASAGSVQKMTMCENIWCFMSDFAGGRNPRINPA
jgi:hypothetical protein